MVWGFSKQQQPHNLRIDHSLQASQYPEQNSLNGQAASGTMTFLEVWSVSPKSNPHPRATLIHIYHNKGVHLTMAKRLSLVVKFLTAKNPRAGYGGFLVAALFWFV